MAYRASDALAAIVLLLAGCSDPKAVSKDNFRAALQGWFDQNPECVNIGKMPATVRADAPKKQRAGYEVLAAAGLLTVDSRHEERSPLMGADMSYDALIYRPTDTGSQVIRKSTDRLFGGFDLCFARRNIPGVTTYTEPADVMGIKATQTLYRYRLEGIAPWAQAASVRAAFPRLSRALDKKEGEYKASLILTSEGWQHERSLRKLRFRRRLIPDFRQLPVLTGRRTRLAFAMSLRCRIARRADRRAVPCWHLEGRPGRIARRGPDGEDHGGDHPGGCRIRMARPCVLRSLAGLRPGDMGVGMLAPFAWT